MNSKNVILRVIGVIHKGIFILSIPILCISMAIGWEITTPQVYTYGFDKYEVSKATDLSRNELAEIADDFAGYFKSSAEDIDITIMVDGAPAPLFTAEETIHFRDVKGLVHLNRNLMLAALGYILLSVVWLWRKDLGQAGMLFMTGAGFTLALLLVLVLVGIVNFDRLFLLFHTTSFRNDFWSAPGYMLQLFPMGFWYDMALMTVLVSSMLALAFGGLGFGLMKFALKRGASHSLHLDTANRR
ncbi:MAG: TIGR01906 family membrane protein [Chloroflexota bacterium]